MDYKEIGRMVKTLRSKSGWTQEEVAEYAEISPTYLSHIERGTKKASLGVLVRIAEVFGVPMTRLLTGNQDSDPYAYMPEMEDLMDDCTLCERRIIYDVAVATKRSLQKNKWVA